MATFELQRLIADAALVLGSAACSAGRHDWESEGGRSCPKRYDHCSQAVYRCRMCGDYDYGERGGPAHYECRTVCSLPPLGEEDI